MPKLEYPTDEELELWEIEWDHGARDGSTMQAEIGVDSNIGRRKALVAWEYRWDFVKYVLGSVSIYDEGDETKVSRLLPRTFPGKDWLIATKLCSPMKGVGKPGWTPGPEGREWDGVISWPKAAVEFLYEQPAFNLLEDEDTTDEIRRFVENPYGSPEPSAERITMPGAGFQYTADPGDEIRFGSAIDGTAIPFDFARTQPQETFNVMWHNLPWEQVWGNDGSPLKERIFGTGEGDQVPWLGAINSTEIFGKPSGTVALVGVKPHRRKGVDGELQLDLEYQFLHRPSGLNWVWGYQIGGSESVNGWYMVSRSHTFATADTVADFDSIYCARDLADGLFRVGEIPTP